MDRKEIAMTGKKILDLTKGVFGPISQTIIGK
jgi:hypothetical protein